MSSFFSRPNDLDCGGFPRSARATYKSMRGNVLWINDKKWIFYDSKGKWYADSDNNPDKKFGDPGAEEYPEMSFTSGITRQCLGNVFDDAETSDRIEQYENTRNQRRRAWSEFVPAKLDQTEQDKMNSFFTRRTRIERGGRSRRNIKKNKSKKRRSRKTIRRRRRR